MAKESMQLGEGFAATKIGGVPPLTEESKVETPSPKEEPKARHYAIGYGVIAAIIGALIWWFTGPGHRQPAPASMQEQPGFQETLAPKKMGGVLNFNVVRDGVILASYGPFHNTIVNEGETVLRDCFNNNAGTACTNVANFEFHGLGTSAAAIAETDGGCTTELTTQYNPDNTRATGSQTTNGTNVYRTVATNTVDAGVTVAEFCLMDTSTGAGNMWTRILTGSIVLNSGDGIRTTYDLTIE